MFSLPFSRTCPSCCDWRSCVVAVIVVVVDDDDVVVNVIVVVQVFLMTVDMYCCWKITFINAIAVTMDDAVYVDSVV